MKEKHFFPNESQEHLNLARLGKKVVKKKVLK